MIFDESNGSQVEQVDSSVVGKEDPPCDTIKQLAIGDIRPQEDEVTDVVVSQAAGEQVSAGVPDIEREQTPAVAQQSSCATPKSGNAAPPSTTAASPTQIRGQTYNPYLKKKKKKLKI